MSIPRLTNPRIEAATCPADRKAVFLRDGQVPGLAVRVGQSGVKSFVFEGSFRGATVRLTLGPVWAHTLESARLWAKEQRVKIDTGVDPRVELRMQRKASEIPSEPISETEELAPTFGELLKAYQDHLYNRGASGYASAKSIVKTHVSDALKAKPLTDVSPADVADMMRKMMEKGITTNARHARAVVSAAFNLAIKAPYSPSIPKEFLRFNNPKLQNPTVPVAKPAIKTGEEYLLPAALKKLAGELRDKNNVYADAALVILLLGARKAQLLRCTIADWDGTTLRQLDGKGRVGRESRVHMLPPAAVVREILNRHCANREPTEKIFPVHTVTVGDMLVKTSTELGLSPVATTTILRRSIESLLASEGVSQDVRAQILSHDLGGLSTRHYLRHPFVDEKRAALELLEARLVS